MRIDRYVHDERLTWGAGTVLLFVTALHTAGIGGLFVTKPPELRGDLPPVFQITLERLPPPRLPLLEPEVAPAPYAADTTQDEKPRKTRPVPILVDTPVTNPVPPDTQVKKYEIGDELLEGEPGPPSPSDAVVGGMALDSASHEPPLVSNLSLRRMKAPVYPPRCLRMGTEGVVKVRVLVGENGRPQEITISKSSGDSSLDRAAMEAIEDWEFNPATRNGLPIRAWVIVPVAFTLIE
ncbi:MAG: TonB family protein [Steroidobacteraceae bacterium]